MNRDDIDNTNKKQHSVYNYSHIKKPRKIQGCLGELSHLVINRILLFHFLAYGCLGS